MDFLLVNFSEVVNQKQIGQQQITGVLYII